MIAAPVFRGEFPVETYAHKSLNYCRGVISELDLESVSESELVSELKSQKVCEARRIKIKRNGQLIPTKHIILSFCALQLPKTILAGYARYKLQPLPTNKPQPDTNPCTLVITTTPQNLPSRATKDLKKKGKSKYKDRTKKTQSKMSPFSKETNLPKLTFNPAFGGTYSEVNAGKVKSSCPESPDPKSNIVPAMDEIPNSDTGSDMSTSSVSESDDILEYNMTESVESWRYQK
ncbi:hypothetical protein HNY73_010407 [Argiope bruennichi]|uniref:Uncharacterized protein n=1 Tax=Argiope bruennichi TaxID=94029 RepID=A0A8T0F105_ARGBR|nr:hypothetical protein HNY73_010407 [Argiope bruennichi]